MEFPRLVYKNASTHVLANNEDEHAALIAEGWFSTVPEALEGKPTPTPGPAPTPTSTPVATPTPTPADAELPTRDELKQKATELGIEFARNVTDEKLAALIAEALSKE